MSTAGLPSKKVALAQSRRQVQECRRVDLSHENTVQMTTTAILPAGMAVSLQQQVMIGAAGAGGRTDPCVESDFDNLTRIGGRGTPSGRFHELRLAGSAAEKDQSRNDCAHLKPDHQQSSQRRTLSGELA